MAKSIKVILEKSETGVYLFRDNIEEQIKKGKSMEKMSKDTKPVHQSLPLRLKLLKNQQIR